MIHRYWPVAACIIMFGVRESSATNECYELLWYPNTYDLSRGLALGNHSSSPSSAVVGLSGRRVLPFLDPSPPPPQLGRPSFSYLPQLEGEHLLLLPRLRGRSAPQSHRTVSPTTPGVGNSFGFPWPSWSSPAPYKEPESASSPEERLLGLRAKEPDNRSVRPSPTSPVKGMGV